MSRVYSRRRFLDLFAGSGAVGLEALSRGASSVVFVENSRDSHRCILQNIDYFKVGERAQAFCFDVFSGIEKLDKLKKKFDIIFADPPYSTIRVINHEPIYYSHHLLTVLDKISILPVGGTLFIEEGAEVPDIEMPLKTLELKSSRRTGHSVLKEYQKNEIS